MCRPVLTNGGVVLTAVAPTPALSGGVLAAIETAPPTPAPTLADAGPDGDARADADGHADRHARTDVDPAAERHARAVRAATDRRTDGQPTSGRYALLTACPDRSGCWIYHIRSGDNLYSIANYFGVSLKTVQAWNPWTQSGLKTGRELRIPTPTR